MSVQYAHPPNCAARPVAGAATGRCRPGRVPWSRPDRGGPSPAIARGGGQQGRRAGPRMPGGCRGRPVELPRRAPPRGRPARPTRSRRGPGSLRRDRAPVQGVAGLPRPFADAGVPAGRAPRRSASDARRERQDPAGELDAAGGQDAQSARAGEDQQERDVYRPTGRMTGKYRPSWLPMRCWTAVAAISANTTAYPPARAAEPAPSPGLPARRDVVPPAAPGEQTRCPPRTSGSPGWRSPGSAASRKVLAAGPASAWITQTCRGPPQLRQRAAGRLPGPGPAALPPTRPPSSICTGFAPAWPSPAPRCRSAGAGTLAVEAYGHQATATSPVGRGPAAAACCPSTAAAVSARPARSLATRYPCSHAVAPPPARQHPLGRDPASRSAAGEFAARWVRAR